MQTIRTFAHRLAAVGLVAGSVAVATLAAQSTQQTVEVVVTGAGGAIAGATSVLPGVGGLSMPVDATGSGMIVGQVVDAGSNQPIPPAS